MLRNVHGRVASGSLHLRLIKLFTLVMPAALLNIIIASQPVYNFLKLWVRLADDTPQLRGRAVKDLVD